MKQEVGNVVKEEEADSELGSAGSIEDMGPAEATASPRWCPLGPSQRPPRCHGCLRLLQRTYVPWTPRHSHSAPTRWVLALFLGFVNFWSNAPKFRPFGGGGMCIFFLKFVRNTSFRNVWVTGGPKPNQNFSQNRRPKLDAGRIFSNLSAQLAQVCSPGFPVPGEALTYRYVTTQSNRLY